jgi:hypothetical protein
LANRTLGWLQSDSRATTHRSKELPGANRSRGPTTEMTASRFLARIKGGGGITATTNNIVGYGVNFSTGCAFSLGIVFSLVSLSIPRIEGDMKEPKA